MPPKSRVRQRTGESAKGQIPTKGRYSKTRTWSGKGGSNNQPNRKTFKKGEIDPNAPKTPEDRKFKNNPICGAPRTGRSASGPGICCQTAGWGTPHPGVGRCKHHGGCLPGEVRRAEIERAEKHVVMFGAPRDVHPHVALLEEVQRTAGHVDYLRDLITQFDDKNKLTQFTEAGIEPAVWIRMYQDERGHLLKACKAAIDAGVSEREVRLKEEQGRLLAMVLMAFIRDPDLDLTPKQMVFAPKLIRKYLMQAPTEVAADEMPDNVPLSKGDKAKNGNKLVTDKQKVIDV